MNILAKRSNSTYTELLPPADDVIEEGVAGAEVLREADVLLLPLGLPHHLQRQNKNTIPSSTYRSLVRQKHKHLGGAKGTGADQEERAAARHPGDAADAALVEDLAGPQHVLSKQVLEAARRNRSRSDSRE